MLARKLHLIAVEDAHSKHPTCKNCGRILLLDDGEGGPLTTTDSHQFYHMPSEAICSVPDVKEGKRMLPLAVSRL